MSDVIPFEYVPKEEFYHFHDRRVVANKLAQRVLYSVFLAIEGDEKAARFAAELLNVPDFSKGDGGRVTLSFTDHEARPVTLMAGVVAEDELTLNPVSLEVIGTKQEMRQGFFYDDEAQIQQEIFMYESIDSEHTLSVLT